MSKGTLYGVGVGPGDPELLTIKAQRVLKDVSVICMPQSETSSESFAYTIAKGFIDETRQEIMRVEFPTDDESGALSAWVGAAEEIAVMLENGTDVAFITEGDPMIYSTFSYVLESLKNNHPDLAVEIVPGVSSVMAAAASPRPSEAPRPRGWASGAEAR